MPLDGSVALVTGAARRVGRATALRLAEAGMDLALTYHRSRLEAEDLVRQIESRGRRAVAFQIDLAQVDVAEKMHGQFIARFDRLDVLVNNASDFGPSPIGRITTGQFDRHMAINARAPLMLIQKFAPLLGAGWPGRLGRVVNFIDIHVMGQPLTGYATYNASKAAVKEITMTAAMELAPRVTVNAIAPGVVAWAPSYSGEQRRAYLRRVPLQRAGTPQDAASAVLYLVKDASYCTGQILKLDGGRLLT